MEPPVYPISLLHVVRITNTWNCSNSGHTICCCFYLFRSRKKIQKMLGILSSKYAFLIFSCSFIFSFHERNWHTQKLRYFFEIHFLRPKCPKSRLKQTSKPPQLSPKWFQIFQVQIPALFQGKKNPILKHCSVQLTSDGSEDQKCSVIQGLLKLLNSSSPCVISSF